MNLYMKNVLSKIVVDQEEGRPKHCKSKDLLDRNPPQAGNPEWRVGKYNIKLCGS